MPYVINRPDDAPQACAHGTWLAHWRALAPAEDRMRGWCASVGCEGEAEQGVKVRKVDYRGRPMGATLVVPVCRPCASRNARYIVVGPLLDAAGSCSE